MLRCRGSAKLCPHKAAELCDCHTHRRSAVDGAGDGAAGATRRCYRLQKVVAQQLDGRGARPGVPVVFELTQMMDVYLHTRSARAGADSRCLQRSTSQQVSALAAPA